MKHYTEDDYLSIVDLKGMPIGTRILGINTYYSATKLSEDNWNLDDRIDTFRNCSDRFIANTFEYTEFDVIQRGGV